MAITSYAELQQAIQDWLNKPELEQVAPTLIALAEADFQRRVRHRKMVSRQTATLSSSRVPLPATWLEAINLEISGQYPSRLKYASPADLDAYRDNSSSGIGLYYSLVGDEIEVAPTPIDASTIEMIYYAKIPALSDLNTSNWLLVEAPDLYLMASLAQAAPLLGDDARLPLWQGAAEKLLTNLNDADTRSRTSGGPLLRRLSTFG